MLRGAVVRLSHLSSIRFGAVPADLLDRWCPHLLVKIVRADTSAFNDIGPSMYTPANKVVESRVINTKGK